jgi:hypothetical protein
VGLDFFIKWQTEIRGSQDTKRIFNNRLDQNQGNEESIDVTNAAGDREGHW